MRQIYKYSIILLFYLIINLELINALGYNVSSLKEYNVKSKQSLSLSFPFQPKAIAHYTYTAHSHGSSGYHWV